MDDERIKKKANEILKARAAECSYIEYKASVHQKDRILKTICAYGNNYYDNDMQYLFVGIEEENDEQQKAVPKLPLAGMTSGSIEKNKNTLNSLRSFLYPNVMFELIANEFEGRSYILIVVPRQSGGPFMVSERAERDKKINLKAGRYVRIEADTRLARVDEEYDLLRKFSHFHFTSIASTDATIDDLSVDMMREYLAVASKRTISNQLNKIEMARTMGLLDKNDPTESRVKNYAVLMFSDYPERFISHSYVEVIVDMFGTKRKMESKLFKGPIWKQYQSVMNYINDHYLNVLTIREDNVAENRRVANFPFVAVEELVANAIVHNNYENEKAIQIYISEQQINIVNYNKPLPPVRINDLNERTYFNERDSENPEIRDMFKQLGFIESFGTGIGEAKRAMADNHSPELYYKLFEGNVDLTSVVIPVSDEFYQIKNGSKAKEKLWIEDESKDVKELIRASDYTGRVKHNLIRIYEGTETEVFGNSRIADLLDCSGVTATSYIKKLYDDLKLIAPVEGTGKGKYRFVSGDWLEEIERDT